MRSPIVFSLLIALTAISAHAAEPFPPATITFSPANPVPGETVAITVTGQQFGVISVSSVQATLFGRTISIEAGLNCSSMVDVSTVYRATTTVDIPRDASAGIYSVEYHPKSCFGTGPVVKRDLLVTLLQFPFLTCPSTALCLQGNRFRIKAKWSTVDGGAGDGNAVALSNEGGYFWFFTPGNPELLVKVLDACGAPAPAFWTFVTGLTNVAVDLTVTDLKNGTVRTYKNPQGSTFAPILDTSAFRTCP